MSWQQLGSEIKGEASGDESGIAISLSSNGGTLAIGAWLNDGAGLDSGHVRIYEYKNNQWQQLGDDINGEDAGDLSGNSVSLSDDGKTVAIGSYFNDSYRGSVNIFEYKNNQWQQLGSEIRGKFINDFSGTSVSLSDDGKTVAIGSVAPGDFGYVRIFTYDSSYWYQLGSDIRGESFGDYFGNSVSLSDDGKKIAIGAIHNDGSGLDSGHVRVFEYKDNIWQQLGSDFDGKAAGDYAGSSVSLSGNGNVLALSAPRSFESNNSSAGYTRVFGYSNENWEQLGSDIEGTVTDDYAGGGVSLSYDGSFLITSGEAGYVKVFRYTNDNWIQAGENITTEVDSNTTTPSVDISDDGAIAVLGEPWNNQVRSFELLDKTLINNGEASFSIVGTKSPGNYLSIKRNSQDPDGTGKLTYQWQTSIDGSNWIDASSQSSYKLRVDDANKYIKAIISYTDDDGFDESVQTSSTQIENHSLSNSVYSSLGYSEVFGTNSSDSLSSSANQIVWGLGGDDKLTNSYSSEDQYLIGGSGDDTYTIRSGSVALVYEAPNQGKDVINIESSYDYGYVAILDNNHLIAIENSSGTSGIIVLNAIEAGGVDEIYFNGAAYSTNYFLSILSSFPGYLGNITWDYLITTLGDLGVNAAKNMLKEIELSAVSLENSFANLDSTSGEIKNSSQIIGDSYHLTGIRDYNGNFHANTGLVSEAAKVSYKYQGMIDVNNDGEVEAIYTNKETGRWVTASVVSSTGEIDYSDHGEGGTTRIVGIYEDPLIAEGTHNGGFLSDGITPAPANFGVSDEERYVEVDGETIDRLALNSQVRFQNDLEIDNLTVKVSGDFDDDGIQEVYWKTNDGTAYLRALMHDDGNIRYANYQSEDQMSDYLTSNGYESNLSEIIS